MDFLPEQPLLGLNPATSTNYCVILGECLDLSGPLFLCLEMGLVTIPASKGGGEHPGTA